jgi:hypothetical protein
MKKIIVYLWIACVIVFISGKVFAKTYEDCNTMTKTGLYVASSLLTIPYFGVKAGYAILGTLAAGTINGVTGKRAEPYAETLAIKSTGGDWYITPRILLREKKLIFYGAVD